MTDGEQVLQKQAWDFFAIVAAQRLTVINFYIAIATVLAGGQVALLQSAQYAKAAGALGVLLITISFVFWKWDKRSSDLIKLAEETIRHYERRTETSDADDADGSLTRLFAREHRFTSSKKAQAHPFNPYFTYRICLNCLYGLFSVIGIAVTIFALKP
jgi:hypothetical protein